MYVLKPSGVLLTRAPRGAAVGVGSRGCCGAGGSSAAWLAPLRLEQPRRAPGQQPGSSCSKEAAAARGRHSPASSAVPKDMRRPCGHRSHCMSPELITSLSTSLAWAAVAVASTVTVTGSFWRSRQPHAAGVSPRGMGVGRAPCSCQAQVL